MEMRSGLRGMAASLEAGADHPIEHSLWLESCIRLTYIYIVSGHDPGSSSQVAAMQKCVKKAERTLPCCMANGTAFANAFAKLCVDLLGDDICSFCFSKRLWRCRLGQMHGLGLSVWRKSGCGLSEIAMAP